jgi:hypothetical protein
MFLLVRSYIAFIPRYAFRIAFAWNTSADPNKLGDACSRRHSAARIMLSVVSLLDPGAVLVSAGEAVGVREIGPKQLKQ